MVRLFLLLAALCVAIQSHSDPLGADDLRARMKGSAASQQASAERLKLMRDGRYQATMLEERRLFYQLPSGRKVEAVLLPNNKRSPAITKDNKLVPACYTKRDTLIAGEFDVKSGRVVCNIPAADVAYIDDDLYAEDVQKEHSKKSEVVGQEGAGSSTSNSKPGISKYGNDFDGNSYNQPATTYKNDTANGVVQKTPNAVGAAAVPPRVSLPADFYMPSTSQQGGKAAVSVMAFSKQKPYGIERGTWLDIRLNRSVSSGDSGQAEFVLESDVAGSFQTLPSGTLFFANKQINMSTKRMEAFVTLAKLPGGKEIEVNGWIYSVNQTAGLTGVLERDREGENKAAAGNAALAGLGTAASAVGAGGDVAGAAINSYTGEMVSNERKYAERAPAATIRVSPTRALLQVSEPF